MTRVILAIGAVVGVTLGLLLPAPAHHTAHAAHLITPGVQAG